MKSRIILLKDRFFSIMYEEYEYFFSLINLLKLLEKTKNLKTRTILKLDCKILSVLQDYFM